MHGDQVYACIVSPTSLVAFLAGWVGGSVSLGLCLLMLTICVVYTGCLCKPKRRLPKTLVRKEKPQLLLLYFSVINAPVEIFWNFGHLYFFSLCVCFVFELLFILIYTS